MSDKRISSDDLAALATVIRECLIDADDHIGAAYGLANLPNDPPLQLARIRSKLRVAREVLSQASEALKEVQAA